MRWLALALLSLPLCAADLASVRQEPNLERRSQLALEYAGAALVTARAEYQAGNAEKSAAAINEAGDAVELTWQSLLDNGKEARRDPKYFKRAELATRQLLRRIEGLAEAMSYQDRPLAEKLRDRVSAVHDDLVNALMSKKRK
ncbi:MAG: hypothetical protein EXQ47_06870 [Bryobacterales bacterium]|nr:hypothetical protein [Bryobacterales bacterium]